MQVLLFETKKYINDVNTYRSLGLLYFESGQYQKAEEEFRYVIYICPENIKAYNDLASLYVYRNEYKKAIEQWNKALELDMDFKEKHIFLYYIGMAYQKKQMPDKALEYFKEALSFAPERSLVVKEIEEEINKIYKSH